MADTTRPPESGDRARRGWEARLLGLGFGAATLVGALATALTGGRRSDDGPDGAPNGPSPTVHEADRPPPGGLQHPNVRYETSDVQFRWILGLVLGAVVFAAAAHYALYVFYRDYRDHLGRQRRSSFPLAVDQPPDRLPAEPRLEQLNGMERNPKGDVFLRLENKERLLNSYGPVPENSGHIHIPIDRALELLADRLPVRKDQPSPEQWQKQNGLVDAGEPNSGRLFREKPR